MYYLSHTYTKRYVVYVKFKFTWLPYNFFGNSTSIAKAELDPSTAVLTDHEHSWDK